MKHEKLKSICAKQTRLQLGTAIMIDSIKKANPKISVEQLALRLDMEEEKIEKYLELIKQSQN